MPAPVLVLVLVLMMLLPLALGCGGGDARLDRALAYEESGRIEAANTLYRWVLRERPDDPTALHGLAVNLFMAQRYDDALAYQERVAAIDESDARIRVELGFNYLNHQADPDEAIRWFREAVAISPTAQYETFLAQAMLEADHFAEAEELLLQTSLEHPDYGRARDLLEWVQENPIPRPMPPR